MSRVVAALPAERSIVCGPLTCTLHQPGSPSRSDGAFAGAAAFDRWACRIANLLGRVSEERITESEVQRWERPTFHDHFARVSTDDDMLL